MVNQQHQYNFSQLDDNVSCKLRNTPHRITIWPDLSRFAALSQYCFHYCHRHIVMSTRTQSILIFALQLFEMEPASLPQIFSHKSVGVFRRFLGDRSNYSVENPLLNTKNAFPGWNSPTRTHSLKRRIINQMTTMTTMTTTTSPQKRTQQQWQSKRRLKCIYVYCGALCSTVTRNRCGQLFMSGVPNSHQIFMTFWNIHFSDQIHWADTPWSLTTPGCFEHCTNCLISVCPSI